MDETSKKQYWMDNYEKMSAFLAFLLPMVIMIAVFAVKRIFPFGDRSFLYSDLYHQYVPFFYEFSRAIRSGSGLGYSFYLGLGSNFLALYSYYLASPLNWLLFLVPTKYIVEFVTYLVVLKTGFCGLTAFCYLRAKRDHAGSGALLFSLFYALSGYMAAYNWNIMWLDCLILFPLILLGLERLVKQGKGCFYCFVLALSIMTNFYLSIMICIFLVLYFCYLFLEVPPGWITIGKFIYYSLLAAGLAAFLLIPAICGVLSTDFGKTQFPGTVKTYFSFLDILARHCMGVAAHRGLEHWPNIYCGIGVFLFMPLYVMNKRIPLRQRFGKLALVSLFLLSFRTNVLEFIWHGFNFPNSLPARQSFIYIFLVITICYEAYCDLSRENAFGIVKAYLCGLGFLLLIEKAVSSKDFSENTVLVNLIFLTLYAVLLYLYQVRDRSSIRMMISLLALVLVIAECSKNMLETGASTTQRSAYVNTLEAYRTLYERNTDSCQGPIRFEKFTHKTKNDGVLAGFSSASLFSSTCNSAVTGFYKRMGMRYSKVFYGYDGATPLSAALLNVGYLYGETGAYANTLFNPVDQEGRVTLYENRMSLPFGYMVPFGFDLPAGFTDKGIYLQNYMVRQLGFTDDLFEKVSAERVGDDTTFIVPQNGIYYGMVVGSGTKKIAAYGGHPEEQKFSDLKDRQILYLGYLEEGAVLRMTNDDSKDTTREIDVEVFLLQEDLCKRVVELFGKNHMEDISYEAGVLEGKITLAEKGRVVLSLPKDTGWKVLVNGKKTTPHTFGNAFLALDLDVGEYEIKLYYVPTGLILGSVMSGICLLLFLQKLRIFNYLLRGLKKSIGKGFGSVL